MRRLVSVAVVTLLAVVSISASAPRREPMPFSIVVETTKDGWKAECERGCAWTKAGFGCEAACDAIIDEHGIVTLATMRAGDERFGFVVHRTADRVQATPRTGTTWEAVSWTCPYDGCRARVTEDGVSRVTGR